MLRFAPSPTGDMHIDNLRVAIFNYIMSKKLNEDLIVRIDDTEKEDIIEGKDKEILELLSLFSIEYKNVVHQSDSLKYHQKIAMQLLTQKKAFVCFCGDEKLEELNQKAIAEGKTFTYDGFCENLSDEAVLEVNAPFTVRIRKPESNIEFTDLLKGNLNYDPSLVDSFIILKHDKTPNGNYACAIDDMLMDISLVIRNEDNISNTPKQIHIRNSLGYDKNIKYAHLPAIINSQSGEIMSENDNVNSVKWLIEEGYLPSAIANYLVLLGNTTPSEIFSLEEAIEWFELENLSNTPSEFDIEKLKTINKKHIESFDDMRLSKILGFADSDIGKLAKIFLQEASTIKEIKEKITAIFTPKDTCEGFTEEFNKLKKCLKTAPYIDSFDEIEKYLSKETNLKGESLTNPLRYLLTGNNSGPELSAIYSLTKNYLGEIVK